MDLYPVSALIYCISSTFQIHIMTVKACDESCRHESGVMCMDLLRWAKVAVMVATVVLMVAGQELSDDT